MLEEELKAEAKRLGFLLAGITHPAAPAHFNIYAEWLAAGRHADMNYLAAERARTCRADPRALMPDVKSILVLAWSYSSPGTMQADGGIIAAYAHGEDYHNHIPPRLKSLAAWLQQKVGQPIKAYANTDTGPVLERDLAQRAGLGWIGKNTCLISPKVGSFFLLAELLLDFPLRPDAPFDADRCGSCQRCIQACPTGCILPNRTIDSRRCISYLTIENKGAIPPELRPKMGHHIFGCDICQQVCPWNSGCMPGEPAPRVDLSSELCMDAQTFNHKFRGSAVQRAKRRGYLRSTAVAAGNLRQAETLPALVRALESDPEPLIRAHAAWAVGQFGTLPARDALSGALKRETDPSVIAEILSALS